jgi:hypothetical protein
MPGFHLWYVALAAAHGQLGDHEPGRRALADLLSVKPDYAATARSELLKIWEPALVDHLIEGLRLAGLDVAAAEPAAKNARADVGTRPS